MNKLNFLIVFLYLFNVIGFSAENHVHYCPPEQDLSIQTNHHHGTHNYSLGKSLQKHTEHQAVSVHCCSEDNQHVHLESKSFTLQKNVTHKTFTMQACNTIHFGKLQRSSLSFSQLYSAPTFFFSETTVLRI